MALNIKDPETEQLAREVAALAGESKTAAVREALRERKQRLLRARGGVGPGTRLLQIAQEQFWPKVPPELLGKPISKEEEEEILGLGPDGV